MLSRLPRQSSWFLQRESDDGKQNKDLRRRNRLSKPPSHRGSFQYLSALSLLELGDTQGHVPPLGTAAEGAQEEYHTGLGADSCDFSEILPISPSSQQRWSFIELGGRSWEDCAPVVEHLERRSSTIPNLGEARSPLSAQSNMSRLSVVSSKESQESKGKISPLTSYGSGRGSRDDLATSIPIRRKSLRQPGIATRVKRDEGCSPLPPPVPKTDATCDVVDDSCLSPVASHHESDAPESEVAGPPKHVPPPLVRADTPPDRVCLGGFRLGSLHVTNGRASPAPSDLSKGTTSQFAPNLRSASSEHGDHKFEDDDSGRPPCRSSGTIQPSKSPKLSARSTTSLLHDQDLLRYTTGSHMAPIDAKCSNPDKNPQILKPNVHVNDSSRSASQSVSLAKISVTGPLTSLGACVGSHVVTEQAPGLTTGTDQFEESLSEDGSTTPPGSDSADNSTADTSCYSNDMPPALDKHEWWLSNLTSHWPAPHAKCSSSGSNRAWEEKAEMMKDNSSLGATKPKDENSSTTDVQQAGSKSSQRGAISRPGLRPLRHSVLRRFGSTNTSLPVLHDAHHSSTTISTLRSTASSPPVQKPKKLSKFRLFSQASCPTRITLLDKHDVSAGSIPSVPAPCYEKLAMRVRQVPELDHTYEGRGHTTESSSSSEVDPVKIRFPSPTSGMDDFDRQVTSTTQAPGRRGSSRLRWGRSDKRLHAENKVHDESEADVRAMVHNLGGLELMLGSNPYDVARSGTHSQRGGIGEQNQHSKRHSIASPAKPSPPANGMDAETAAQLARNRSRTIHEQDSLPVMKKCNSSHGRARFPSKRMASDHPRSCPPPLPPLPACVTGSQRESGSSDIEHARPRQRRDRSGGDKQPQQCQDLQSNGWSPLLSATLQDNIIQSTDPEMDCFLTACDHRQSWPSDIVEINYDAKQPLMEFEAKAESSRKALKCDPRMKTSGDVDGGHEGCLNHVGAVASPHPLLHACAPASFEADAITTWIADTQAWQASQVADDMGCCDNEADQS